MNSGIPGQGLRADMKRISYLSFGSYFSHLCNPERIFTAQVLYPGLPMTIKGASGMIIQPSLKWV